MSRKDFEDDGRTVADMSQIERQPLIMPRFDRLSKKEVKQDNDVEDKPWENSEFSGRDKRSFIAGALGAAMLIGTVFVAAGAVVILLILKLGA